VFWFWEIVLHENISHLVSDRVMLIDPRKSHPARGRCVGSDQNCLRCDSP
jgi:hypothetical protein